MSDDNSERWEYIIPEDIDSRIPDYFYSAMAGELFSVVGWAYSRDIFYPEQCPECVDLDAGTEGWSVALEMTCKKLDMEWLWEYHESLPWQESDILDGIIEQRIGHRFILNRCRCQAIFSDNFAIVWGNPALAPYAENCTQIDKVSL